VLAISLAVSLAVMAPLALQSGWSISHCHSTLSGGTHTFAAEGLVADTDRAVAEVPAAAANNKTTPRQGVHLHAP
jgi:hypothetical protein